MANSYIISDIKRNIINEICNDEDICYFIDSPDDYVGEQLKNTHIFSYNKNPNVVTKNITFITVSVSLHKRDANGVYVTAVVTINIFSDNDHIELENVDGQDNRNDYLSMLLDDKFNGSYTIAGIGKLTLIDNNEFVASEKFLGRSLVFKTMDINDSVCGD